jgi:phosphoglycolate phosphatase-like HAD superfamily hydrolase
MTLVPGLEIVNPNVPLGQVRHALFDFDGTISTIRQGWEEIMVPLMVEVICDGAAPTPEIEAEVRDYVDRSTGILTIRQMEWLAEAVQRHGLARLSSPRGRGSGPGPTPGRTRPLTPRDYKRLYNERLMIPVRERLGRLAHGEVTPDELMIAGARRFVTGLCERGVTLYLASGTDDVYVWAEAEALGIAGLFDRRIYGARDDTEEYTKERIIQRILDDHSLSGPELLVVGDGPVEIRNARARDAVALGVASDEVHRSGLNSRKRRRLLDAGADLIVPDFTAADTLLRFLFAGT